jgi:small-conductance mechanosensitive channel
MAQVVLLSVMFAGLVAAGMAMGGLFRRHPRPTEDAARPDREPPRDVTGLGPMAKVVESTERLAVRLDALESQQATAAPDDAGLRRLTSRLEALEASMRLRTDALRPALDELGERMTALEARVTDLAEQPGVDAKGLEQSRERLEAVADQARATAETVDAQAKELQIIREFIRELGRRTSEVEDALAANHRRGPRIDVPWRLVGLVGLGAAAVAAWFFLT